MTPPPPAGGRSPAGEPAWPGGLLGRAAVYWALWALALVGASSLVLLWFGEGGSQALLMERKALAGLATAALPLAFAAHGRRALPWRGHGEASARALALVPLCYAAFFVAWAPVALLLYPRLLEQWGGSLPAQPELDYFAQAPASPLGCAAMIALVCAVAPVLEEVLFRGYLQTAARHVMPRWAAILLAAVPFGLIHGVSYAFPVGLLGVFFGWVRERPGGVVGAIAAHALHNTVAVALTAAFPDLFHWLYR